MSPLPSTGCGSEARTQWEPSPGAQPLLSLGVGWELEKRIARALPLSAHASEEMALWGHTGVQRVGFFKICQTTFPPLLKNLPRLPYLSWKKPKSSAINPITSPVTGKLTHPVSHTGRLVASPNSRHIPAPGPFHWLFPRPETLHSDICISAFSFPSNFSSEVPFLAWSSRSLSWKPQLAPSTTPAPLIYSPTAFYITFKHSVLLSFSHQVMSDSLWLHGLQHARVLCLPLSPGFCSNSCPLTQWCYLTISSSVIPFFCLQSFPDSASFLMSQIFASGCQSIRAAASASVLPMNIQGWLPLGLTGLIYLQSKGLSRVFSSTTIRKHPIPFSYFLSLNYYLSPLPPSTHINVNSTNVSTFSCLSTVVFSAPSTELRM